MTTLSGKFGDRVEERRASYTAATAAAVVEEMAATGTGDRNGALYRCARRLASYAGRGYLSENMRDELREAARRAGLSGSEIRPTLASGWRAGLRDDPHFPEELRGSLPALRSDIATEPPPAPPPADEVAEFWDKCRPIYGTPIAGALRGRHIDPAAVEDGDLARTLPPHRLPNWARSAGGDWRATGHNLILSLYDAAGELRTVHARSLDPAADAKGLRPKDCGGCGFVLACPMALVLLRTGTAPPCWNGEVHFTEGATDFSTMATRWSDAAEEVPALIGYITGSYSTELCQRIPAGTIVRIWPHKDEAGAKMAHRFADGLAHCTVTWGEL